MKNLLISAAILLFSGISAQTLTVNPYSGVQWKTQHKANFHTHTNNSDGGFNAEYVVDTYKAHHYSILVITDHNLVTYPWTKFSALNPKWKDRNDQKMDILTFPGNEFSRGGHDRNMFFAQIPGDGADIDLAFKTMQDSLSLGIFNHPGRYWKIDKTYTPGEKYSPEWYVDYFKKYNSVVGVEVYNTPYDRYPNDRLLWDEILTRSMPATPVWAYSNDDMHGEKELMGNYNMMLMKNLSVADLKKAMIAGNFYISHEPGKSGKALAPKITGISVHPAQKKIKVSAKNYSSIEWISGIEGNGADRKSRVIATGPEFDFNNFKGNYVRFQIKNDQGVTLSQPFGFQ
ncbi:PHP domain-containing protein [Chryseobacterium koreense]